MVLRKPLFEPQALDAPTPQPLTAAEDGFELEVEIGEAAKPSAQLGKPQLSPL
jgi:hypothetical protein